MSIVPLWLQKQREVREKEEAIRRQKEQVGLYGLLLCSTAAVGLALLPSACAAPPQCLHSFSLSYHDCC